MLKICHLTSAHIRYDVRIFLKECVSLAHAGYDVTLVCADDKDNEIKDGVYIISTRFVPKNRIHRLRCAKKALLKSAREIDADVYHFHDPDLLSVGYSLKKQGKTVIYDTHEDVPRQIMGKTWIPRIFRTLLAYAFEKYENYHAKHFDHIITATPHIRTRFVKLNPRTTTVNNYPLHAEFAIPSRWDHKKSECCYIGCIDVIRGIYQIINSLAIAQIPTHFCGTFESAVVQEKASALAGFSYIKYHGQLSRSDVQNILSQCKIGLITYLPDGNHIASQPNKLFEYMAAGIPVVASNFPLWKEIVEENHCGICVDPENPHEIADAIRLILANDEHARVMGENGKKAITEKYNWSIEEAVLLNIYRSLPTVLKK